MTNSYLLEVIKALNHEEREEILWFLKAPAISRMGNARELNQLYQIILEASPGFSSASLQKQVVYQQIFPEPGIIPGKLEKLMAELNKIVRNYTLSKQYLAEQNDTQQQLDWAKWLREHGMADRSKQVVTKLFTQKLKGSPESIDKYKTVLLISEEIYLWEGTYNQLKGDLGIPNLIYYLELFYQNYNSELINRYLLQQKGPQLPDLTWINRHNSFWQEESTLLKLSKGINQVLSKDFPTVKEFQDLLQLISSKETELSFETLAQYYSYLRNTCTLLINGGNLEFIPVLHEIHKDNLQRDYFLVNGEITPNVYLNLVQIATRAGESDWAKAFTETFRKKILGGDDEQHFYGLNMAQCLFAEGNFDEALNHIPDVPSSSYYHHIARRLELKLYYELDSELLSYKIDAFRKFFERTGVKSISPDQRTLHINFAHILLQLSQSPKKDKVRSARLIARINSKTLIAERAWLLEKARELG